jgi:glycosyltransferase involved in cell wall biosynthesis
MEPLVTIISPTYNHEAFIKECIQSALNQTYSNWEMVIVDDGSTDNTYRIAEELAKTDSRIKLFTQKNKGVFKLDENYNFALSQSGGKYVAILEGDDYWNPDKLKKQVEVMEADAATVLAWTRANMVHAYDKSIITTAPGNDNSLQHLYLNNPPGDLLKILYFRNCIPALTILIRRSALDAVGGFKSGYGLPLVDYPTILELIFKGTFYFDDYVSGAWRIYGSQVTKVHTTSIFNGMAGCAINHYKKNEDNPLVKTISLVSIQRSWNKLIGIASARSGRYKLIRKDFAGARKDYLKSIFAPGFNNFVWRIRSVIGFTFSLLHLNVEGLAKFLGKESYKK